MKDAAEFHRRAMHAAEAAVLARVRGNAVEHRAKIREAFELEKQAAALVAGSNMEPTRSVLHRSAASLALECREFREAERLIALGLTGAPPHEVLDELRNLLQDVHFHQHLADDGLTLQRGEFEYQMIGAKVGKGIAPGADFARRFEHLDMVVFRTAERKANKPFRTQGRRDLKLQDDVEIFVKTPRAASFAVAFQIGKRGLFSELDFGADVVDEILSCFEYYSHDDIDSLRRRIPDENYFKNFVGLARKLAPDGKNVGTVGISGKVGSESKEIVLKPQSGAKFGAPSDLSKGEEVERIEVSGVLKMADSDHKNFGLIKVVQDDGTKTQFRVSPSVMSDVVRPYFETRVLVTGYKKGKHYHYSDVQVADS